MIDFAGRGILLDIEGTVAPIAYVAQTLVPFARDRLDAFLREYWDRPEVAAAREQVARDAGAVAFHARLGDAAAPEEQRRRLVEHLNGLMDRDVKATGLKSLQGMIWAEGYRSGALRSELFPDVPPTLRRWHAAGLDLRVFSSGSVAAQLVFFEHTEAGDLLPLFRGHYDTTTGPKKEAASYRRIAAAFDLPPEDILFLSDVPGELDAAAAAGMQVACMVRPGNAPLSADMPHPQLRSLEEVAVSREGKR